MIDQIDIDLISGVTELEYEDGTTGTDAPNDMEFGQIFIDIIFCITIVNIGYMTSPAWKRMQYIYNFILGPLMYYFNLHLGIIFH